MCSQNSRILITDVIGNSVATNELFTAFDISRQVQVLARQQNVAVERHREMRDYIHEVMKDYENEYEGTSRSVGSHRAIVYHPNNISPDNYHPIPEQVIYTADSNVVPPVDSTNGFVDNLSPINFGITSPDNVTFSPNDGHVILQAALNDQIISLNKVYVPDNRGTLTIPTRLVRQLGFSHKDDAFIFQNDNQLRIVKDFLSANLPIATYTVDEYCNIRMTSFVLDRIDNKNEFSITATDAEIVIKAL